MRKSVMVLLGVALMVAVVAGPASAALDVEEIFISQYKDYWDNTVETNPYGMEIWINGTGVSSVSVEDPYAVSHDLSDEGGGEWSFEDWGFADLTALDGSYGPGNYVFTFNDGEGDEDTVTINYQYTLPGGFANITNPTDGATGVALDPTYTWDSVDGFGDVLGMWVVKDSDGDDVYGNVPDYDMTRVDWQPGALLGLTDYELELSVFEADGDAPQSKLTDGEDEFDYYGLFEYINGVAFTTVPEPVTLGVLLMGGVGMLLGRRRK